MTKLTTGVSLTPDALALNFPSTVLAPSIGIIVGGANAVLNARISALEATSQGKVISAPRVLIADDEKAVIEQGEEIPVITPATANTPASTTYKPAVLRLEVKPKIIVDDYLLLTIQAKNDRANRADRDPNTGNMPIFTSKIDSKVAVRDGDTIVIGGVKKTADEKGTTGLPWLSSIPVLGWLFKAETVDKSTQELLIFVTPRIMNKAATPAIGAGATPKKGVGG
jgi:type IV pilus assembly protein PilQ